MIKDTNICYLSSKWLRSICDLLSKCHRKVVIMFPIEYIGFLVLSFMLKIQSFKSSF